MKLVRSYSGKPSASFHWVAGVCVVLATAVAFGKPPKPAKPPGETEKPAAVAGVLPTDLNAASLRVTALDALYQFDFSREQLNAMLAESQGSASTEPRAPAKGNEKLAGALNELATALLESADDAQISKLRNDVIELVSDDAVELNDAVHPTAHAIASTPKVFALLKASQIASYLATHAHEVGDPQEVLTAAMEELRDNHTDADAGKNVPLPEDAGTALISETAIDVGYLMAGLDDAKAKTIGDQVSEFLKSAFTLKDADFKTQRPALEASIKKLTADVPAIQVLNNWLQRQIAVLLSNPQLSSAIAERFKADAKPPATKP